MRFSTIVASLESLDLRELVQASRLVEPSGSIHVLYTLPPHGRGAAAEAELRDALEELQSKSLHHPKGCALSLHVGHGDRGDETIRLAVECRADLIVLGAHQSKSASAVSQVLRAGTCSVLVLSPNQEREVTEGLVPQFSLCDSCEALRGRTSNQWFCDVHEDPSKRIFKRLA